jgi:hypothetical protein
MCMINKIFWKRTYLFIEFSAESAEEICIKNKETGRMVSFETRKLRENYYRAKLNITIANGRNLLEEGRWLITLSDGSPVTDYPKCIIENPYIGQRVFRYTGRFYSYAFRMEVTDEGLTIVNGHYMSVKKNRNAENFRREFFKENKAV